MASHHDKASMDFVIPRGYDVLVSSLSGRLMYKNKVEEAISFKLYSQCVLKALQKSEARNLSVPMDVIQTVTWIQWQPPEWEQPLTGTFLIRSLTCDEHDILTDKNDASYWHSLLDPCCVVCFSNCTEAGSGSSNVKASDNCERCSPCYLCPHCKVFVNSTPVCYHCLEEADYASLTDMSDICWKRLGLLSLPDADDISDRDII